MGKMAKKKQAPVPKKPAVVKETLNASGGVSISSSDFKTHCLALMERVRQTREEITVTKYGKPVAKLVPVPEAKPQVSLFGYMRGTVVEYGDIISPIDVEWEAEVEPHA
jgi:prevent-host-death family protein